MKKTAVIVMTVLLATLTCKAITAEQLAAAYDANEVSADEQYKGKQVTVTGKIKSIGKDILKTPYVTLETSDLITSVQCMFSSKDTSTLSSLAKGESITISGTVSGKLMNILIKDCTIKD